MTQEEVLHNLPEAHDDMITLYIDDKPYAYLDANRSSEYRVNIVKYIKETGDVDILNRFYFIGHMDSNDEIGEQIKITMDENGNLSCSPYELNHVRRSLLKLINMDKYDTKK